MSSFNANLENDEINGIPNDANVIGDEDTSGDGFTFDNKMFDEDGNFIIQDENDVNESANDVNGSESTTEVDEQKTVQEEKTVSETVKPSTKAETSRKTPEEMKIIGLKRELQSLQRERAEMQKALDEQNRKKEKEALISKYVDNGIDEETAKLTADSEIRTRQLEEKLELLEFKEQNEAVLSKYANAKNDISTIVKNAKLTGMTVEQICRGMYGEQSGSDYEKRAIAAAKGIGSNAESKGSNVASAERNSAQPQSTLALSMKDREMIKVLEGMKGEKLTNDEIKKYFSK